MSARSPTRVLTPGLWATGSDGKSPLARPTPTRKTGDPKRLTKPEASLGHRRLLTFAERSWGGGSGREGPVRPTAAPAPWTFPASDHDHGLPVGQRQAYSVY